MSGMDRGIELIADGEMRLLCPVELLKDADDDGVMHLGSFLAVGDGRFVTVTAEADDYVASIPSESFTSGARLHVPTARLTVEEGSTLCWNVKHVTKIEVGAEQLPDSVPENPPH